MALRAALKLGYNWTESGHVLLGLIDLGPSPGYEILAGLAVDGDSLRERVVALLFQRYEARHRVSGGAPRIRPALRG
ncbi:MAG: Clp protease N-terminal domain-containing protein [Solirubrobacteraceae bacterium]